MNFLYVIGGLIVLGLLVQNVYSLVTTPMSIMGYVTTGLMTAGLLYLLSICYYGATAAPAPAPIVGGRRRR